MCHFLTFFTLKNTKRVHTRRRGYIITMAGIILSLLLIIVTQTPAELMPLEELIAKAQERYEKSVDLKARFIQETTIKAMNKPNTL